MLRSAGFLLFPVFLLSCVSSEPSTEDIRARLLVSYDQGKPVYATRNDRVINYQIHIDKAAEKNVRWFRLACPDGYKILKVEKTSSYAYFNSSTRMTANVIDIETRFTCK